MDLRECIAKVEAVVETLKRDIDRLYDAIEKLRQHTDNGFAELRAFLDSLHRETNSNMRWLIRLLLAIVAMIAGMFAKVLGLY